MKIIHTADWHLGQTLHHWERYDEHAFFLEQLRQVLQDEQPDLLLVAGDVFDTGSPSHRAIMQYTSFLAQAQLFCQQIIITGGNHDSPQMLNATRDLLKCLNIHVIGGRTQTLEEQLITVRSSKNGNIIGVVAAVPFLRDGGVASIAGETVEQKRNSMREGIKQHYAALRDLALPYTTNKKVPLIALGHLYAAGSELSGNANEENDVLSSKLFKGERDINYAGNQDLIDIDVFPPEFDYIALGHIHKAQKVGKKNHIRYSGSPIPLSFSERNDQKQVLKIDFEGNREPHITPILLKTLRRLVQFKGTVQQVFEQITAFENLSDDEETVLAVAQIETDTREADMEQKIRDLIKSKGKKLDLLAILLNIKQKEGKTRLFDVAQDLHTLSEISVFKECCESEGIQDISDIEPLFCEILENVRALV